MTGASSTLAVRVIGLVKEFPVMLRGMRLRAVDHLSLEVPAGTIFGLLGPNGSGKSTTIKAILGLVRPTAGHCELFGADHTDRRARSAVGYLPEAPDFQRFLTARELLVFHARLALMDRRTIGGRVGEVLDWVGLGDAADRRLGTFSKGMLQRVGLAQALVHDPRLLILDEPTAGVDPLGVADIARLLVRLRATGKTVLLSSHLLAQVEDVCDRVAILHQGKLIFSGDVASLGGPGEDAIVVRGLAPAQIEALRSWLSQRSAELVRVEKLRPRLDQLFLERVGAAAHKERDQP